MNDSRNVDSPQDGIRLNLWVPEMSIKMSIRARLAYAKLARLQRPISARKLSLMFGGLRISERTVGAALRELRDSKLVTQSNDGWTAVPAHEQPAAFAMVSGKNHPYYFTMITPDVNPFPGQKNAIELLAVYYCCAYLTVQSMAVFNTDIAKRTGIGRKAVGEGVKELQRLNLLDADKHALPQTWKNAAHSPDDMPTKATKKTPVVRQEEQQQRHPINVLLDGKTQEAACRRVIGQLTKAGITEAVIIKDIKEAHDRHHKNGAAGDGSALVLSWLERRRDDKEAAVKGAEEMSKAARREYDAQRDRQIRSAALDRLNHGDRAAGVDAFDAYAVSQLDAADTALTGIGRRLSLAELVSVIADPTRAAALKVAPVETPKPAVVEVMKPPVNATTTTTKFVYDNDPEFDVFLHALDSASDEDDEDC